MAHNIEQHPAICHYQDLADICKPLTKLDISYFAHVHIDKEGCFSALTNNPGFTEHYIRNEYYNADIHMAETDKLGSYILWDAIDRCGLSEKMHIEAAQFGVQHTFTIIEKTQNGNHYYHFANNSKCKAINQTYLNNIDLLELFIPYFHENVQHSQQLSKAYDLTFCLDKEAGEYAIKAENELFFHKERRSQYLQNFMSNRISSIHKFIVHKDTSQILAIPPQQAKCLFLALQGKTAKQIAAITSLSNRTVENYLLKIRKTLGCRTSKALIADYYSQRNRLKSP